MHDYDFGDLKVGMRVNVEGDCAGDGSWRARQISVKEDGDADELEGAVQGSDPAQRLLRVLGLAMHVPAAIEILDLEKHPADLEALVPGTRVKIKGRLGDGRSFDPHKIKLKVHTPDCHDEIEGRITAVDSRQRTLTVLGFRVWCADDVAIES